MTIPDNKPKEEGEWWREPPYQKENSYEALWVFDIHAIIAEAEILTSTNQGFA